MTMQSQWYYSRAGSQVGPVPIENLRDLVLAGQLGYDDNIWSDGMPNWVPIRHVPMLMSMLSAAAPSNQMNQYGGGQAAQYGGGQSYGAQQYGASSYGGYDAQRGPSSSGMGVASLILGLVGVCFSPLALVGMILGIIALNNMKKNRNPEGKGVATAGLIISIVVFVLGCIGGIVYFSMMQAERAHQRQYYQQQQYRYNNY